MFFNSRPVNREHRRKTRNRYSNVDCTPAERKRRRAKNKRARKSRKINRS